MRQRKIKTPVEIQRGEKEYHQMYKNFCCLAFISNMELKELYGGRERAQHAANRKNTCKLRKQLKQFYNTTSIKHKTNNENLSN